MTEVFSNFPAMPQTINTQTKTVTPTLQVQDSLAATSVSNQDNIQLTTQPKEKKGFIKSIKGMIAGVKKFFAAAGEYTKGTLKGLGAGIVSASIFYTAGDIANKTILKNKTTKFPNKAIAIVSAAVALAGNIWKASLDATEKQSKIDHRWTGHD